MSNKNFKCALRTAKSGHPVFPCHSIQDNKCTCGDTKCKNPGKHPRTKDGVLSATTDESIIKTWWSIWKDSNVGIPIGTPCRGYFFDTGNSAGWVSLSDL